MESLGHHWVFCPFRLVLSADAVTYFVVHWGGFLLDLSIGFFMLMERTRGTAFLFCAIFNLMNSRMFTIGMFPYVMVAIMPIFCAADWPRQILNIKFPLKQKMYECVHPKNKALQFRQKCVAAGLCCYLAVQLLLPFSHSITPGLDAWTEGPYGYSWDMMVYSWRHLHTTVTVQHKATGQLLHIDPKAWTHGYRWTHHPQTVKQFADCVREKMRHALDTVEIGVYVDSWHSLNHRFAQRMYDPRVDMVSAPWSPFERASWVLPLQAHLTQWRDQLIQWEEYNTSTDVVFVADFPGLYLLNYVDERVAAAEIRVIEGSVQVQMELNRTVQLQKGQAMQIPPGEYHRVSPLRDHPACYAYVYSIPEPGKRQYCPADKLQTRLITNEQCNGAEEDGSEWSRVWKVLSKSILLVGRALRSIATGTEMESQNY